MLAHQGTLADIQNMEAALATAVLGMGRVRLLIRLAWYLRNRDTRRCAILTGQAMAFLNDGSALDDPESLRLLARGHLLHAHCEIAFAQSSAARSALLSATALFEQLQDFRGLGDCDLAQMALTQLTGDNSEKLRLLDRALRRYQQADWLTGIDEVELRRAMTLGQMGQLTQAQAIVDQRLGQALSDQDYHTRTLRWACLGTLALAGSEYQDATDLLECGLEAAKAESFRAIEGLCQMGLATVCGHIADHAGQLHWLGQAHTTFVDLGYVIDTAMVLNGVGALYIEQGDMSRAMTYLSEAGLVLTDHEGTRAYAQNRCLVGRMALHGNDPKAAGDHFQAAWTAANRLSHLDLQITAMCGLGTALFRQGDPDPAHYILLNARNLAVATQRQTDAEVECLAALAELHQRHPNIAPPPEADGSADIYYLQRAIEIAESITARRMVPRLYAELAAGYERCGDFAAALRSERAGYAAYRAVHTTESVTRMQTQRTRYDLDHIQAVATAELKRAQALEASARTLSLLAEIGQDITASLDVEQIFTALRAHIGALIDTPIFGIVLLKPETETIEFSYIVVEGMPIHLQSVPVDNPTDLAAECLREGREILVSGPEAVGRGVVNSSAPDRMAQTILYRPLRVSGRTLGAITCQSYRSNAYGAQDLDILRTLAAYGAIALANAASYQALDLTVQELKQAQAMLVQQEKMVALGQLVAGVAHEVNTPIGIALAASSGLGGRLRKIDQELRADTLRRSDLQELLADGAEAAGLIERNLIRAGELIGSFKEIAVDQSSDLRRRFDLSAYLEEIITSLGPRLRRAGHRVVVQAEAEIIVDSYPGAMAQIVTNLVLNAVDHAFAKDQPGSIRLELWSLDAQRMELSVIDDGCGMTQSVQDRIFDPFFTTRRAEGNTGLGLHLVFNLTHQRLGGTIRVESRSGAGTRFILTLPKTAPQKSATTA